jgi:hypothetical protein
MDVKPPMTLYEFRHFCQVIREALANAEVKTSEVEITQQYIGKSLIITGAKKPPEQQ